MSHTSTSATLNYFINVKAILTTHRSDIAETTLFHLCNQNSLLTIGQFSIKILFLNRELLNREQKTLSALARPTEQGKYNSSDFLSWPNLSDRSNGDMTAGYLSCQTSLSCLEGANYNKVLLSLTKDPSTTQIACIPIAHRLLRPQLLCHVHDSYLLSLRLLQFRFFLPCHLPAVDLAPFSVHRRTCWRSWSKLTISAAKIAKAATSLCDFKKRNRNKWAMTSRR